MEDYLRATKQGLTDLSGFQKVHGILGNEACDLDSAVAAITYGFYLHSIQEDETTLFLPILNIPRDQFPQRTETTFFLSKVNLSHDLLTFRNEVDLTTLHSEGKLQLTLVDNNVLPGNDAILEDTVVTVIDHRARERPESDETKVILEVVGSCCTLIAEQLLQHPFFHMDDQTATLLYGTILVDTINRSAQAGKTTEKDEEIIRELEAKIPDVDGRALFEEIMTAKFDLSSLSCEELLNKDVKMLSNANMTIAMISVTMQMKTLLGREGFHEALKQYSISRSASVAVIMTLALEGGDVERQLAVYSENRIFRQQIADLLDNSTEPNLQLDPILAPSDNLLCFTQHNIPASRKQVLPILKSFLTGEETPRMDPPGFPFEGLESETIGSDVPLTNIKDSFSDETSQDLPDVQGAESNADPFGLFSDGGEAVAENVSSVSSSNPFTSDGGFDDFFKTGNSSENSAALSAEYDPFGFSVSNNANMGEESDIKKDGTNPMDAFIDNLLNLNNSASEELHMEEPSEDGFLNPKPDISSGQESPMDCSSGVQSAGSSYPVTPPNSFLESDMDRFAKEHNLPSFNSSEMVKIIKERQASLDQNDAIPEEREDDTFPYTPRNSYQITPDGETFDTHHNLPSFQGAEMLEKIMEKRASLGAEDLRTDSENVHHTLTSAIIEENQDQVNDSSVQFGIDEAPAMSEQSEETDFLEQNVVAQNLAEEMKNTDPFASDFDFESETKIISENAVAQQLAQEMQESSTFNSEESENRRQSSNDPFSFEYDRTEQSTAGFETDMNADNVVAQNLAEEMGTVDPFGLCLNESVENAVAHNLAAEMMQSERFGFDSDQPSEDSADSSAKDLKQSDPFGFGPDLPMENVVAENLACDIQQTDPFASNETPGSYSIDKSVEDPFGSAFKSSLTDGISSTEQSADKNESAWSSSFDAEIEGSKNIAPEGFSDDFNPVALESEDPIKPSEAENMESRPFSEFEEGSNAEFESSIEDPQDLQGLGRVVREPSVENFQDFVPEVDRMVLSAGEFARSARKDSGDHELNSQASASNLDELLGFSDVQATSQPAFSHDTEKMAENIIQHNLEETLQEGLDNMCGEPSGEGAMVSSPSEEDFVGTRILSNRLISGLDNPAFGSFDQSEAEADMQDMQESINPGFTGRFEQTRSEETSSTSVLSEHPVEQEIAADVYSGFSETVTENVQGEPERLEQSAVAPFENIKNEPGSFEHGTVAPVENLQNEADSSEQNLNAIKDSDHGENVPSLSVESEDIMLFDDESERIEQSVVAPLENIQNDPGSFEHGTVAPVENLQNEGVNSEQSLNAIKDSDHAENVPVEDNAEEKNTSTGVSFGGAVNISTDSNEESPAPVKPKTKFGDAPSLSVESEDIMLSDDESFDEDYKGVTVGNSKEELEMEIAQRFAEEIISEACEIVAKDPHQRASTSSQGSSPRGESRTELARRMMEADGLESDEDKEDESEEKPVIDLEALSSLQGGASDRGRLELNDSEFGSSEENSPQQTPDSPVEPEVSETVSSTVESEQFGSKDLSFDKTLVPDIRIAPGTPVSDTSPEEQNSPDSTAATIETEDESQRQISEDEGNEVESDLPSDVVMAQQITDNAVSEALYQISKEQDEIQEKLAEAMEESEGEASNPEAIQAVSGLSGFSEEELVPESETVRTILNKSDEDRGWTTADISDENIQVENALNAEMSSEKSPEERQEIHDLVVAHHEENVSATPAIMDFDLPRKTEISEDWHDVSKDVLSEPAVEGSETLNGENDKGAIEFENITEKPSQLTTSNNTTGEVQDLSPRGEEIVKELAYDVADDIIQKALDAYPAEEVHGQIDSEESSSLPSSDISPNSEMVLSDAHMRRSHEMCPVAVQEDEDKEFEEETQSAADLSLSLETEYLPHVDPFHGNLDIVTSPVQTLETDASRDVAESISFKQMSTDVLSNSSETLSEESLTEDKVVTETENTVETVKEESLIEDKIATVTETESTLEAVKEEGLIEERIVPETENTVESVKEESSIKDRVVPETLENMKDSLSSQAEIGISDVQIDISAESENRENGAITSSQSEQTKSEIIPDMESAILPIITSEQEQKGEATGSDLSEDTYTSSSPIIDSDDLQVPMAGKRRKEIYMTTAGRISIGTDTAFESDTDGLTGSSYKGSPLRDRIAEESQKEVGEIIERAESAIGQADTKLSEPMDATSKDMTDEEFLSSKTRSALAEAMDDDESANEDKFRPISDEEIGSRVVPIETEVRLRQDSTSSDTISKSARPTNLAPLVASSEHSKQKIHPSPSLLGPADDSENDVDIDDDTSLSSTDSDIFSRVDDLQTPDIATPDTLCASPAWGRSRDSTPVASPAAEAIPEYSAAEESRDKKSWRKVTVGDQEFTIDMNVVEPYKRVLSHGGYYGDGLNAMVVFSGCYLPDRSRKDYSYVMDNLFYYVISTLDLLVAEDYMIVYFHGATPRRQMPSFGWLKRCYQMIDRRLKKNLKGLLLVHPTLWIKTVVMMSRPFISTKFSSKLRMVKTLADLEKLVPMEYVFVPDQVKDVDKVATVNPALVEKGFEDKRDLQSAKNSPHKRKKTSRFWQKKK